MAKGEEHRYFDKEFKLEALRLIKEGKRSERYSQGSGYSSEPASLVEA